MTGQPVISVRGLTKSYGNKPVLRGLDFDIRPGEVTAYLGSNGAGKSTTLKILLGIDREFGGEVRVFGQDIRTASEDLKGRWGYVPELPDLYDMLSGDEYLRFLGTLHRLDEATIGARSGPMAEVLGLSAALSSRVATYSKGMRQKLLILGSLLHDPDLLVWDEPLSGLDANLALVLKEFLVLAARQGKAVFFSSHVLEVVQKISDRILILHQGVLVADGSFEQLNASAQARDLEGLFHELTDTTDHEGQARDLLEALGTGLR